MYVILTCNEAGGICVREVVAACLDGVVPKSGGKEGDVRSLVVRDLLKAKVTVSMS